MSSPVRWRDMAEAIGAAPASLPVPHDDAIREQAYLIARSVRPLAIIASFSAEASVMWHVASRLDSLKVDGAIPFVIDDDAGLATCGYATAPWAIDLLRWALADVSAEDHRHRIVGLLLGYSPEAIRRHEEQGAGMATIVKATGSARST